MEVNKIYEGDCLEGLKKLPNSCIDCCITSPPYWGLRDYGCEGQLGSEKHFKDFVNKLCNVFDEVKRVLKRTGTCFVNLGDTFNGSKIGNTSNKGYCENTEIDTFKKEKTELPNKSLCMIPERFSIEMIDRGWCLRNQIIWHKPNQMPQSVTDRFTVDFEKIFFFVKKPIGYYFKQQLEPFLSKQEGLRNKNKENSNNGWHKGDRFSEGERNWYSKGERNVRTVWSINTSPNNESHFAMYPQKLVNRMIEAGCPENGLILDPFMGAGTTAIMARKTSRNYIGFELNPTNIKIANQRVYNHLGLFNEII